MTRRSKRLIADIGPFMGQYGRKKRPGKGEPNDRTYDRNLEETVKRMDPVELDALLNGEVEAEGLEEA